MTSLKLSQPPQNGIPVWAVWRQGIGYMNEGRTDQELLRQFVESGSEAAFQSLVERHINLVFATALRRLRDTGTAQEITQNVFVALARKAAWLRGEVGLAGWLHKTAVLEARQWWRGELRRRTREETAAALGTTMKRDDALLQSLAGALDEGLLELRESDRQALMLRYLEGRSHREVGAQLGIGEDAARKRIDKALDQLTRFFQRRGYAVPAATATAAALRGVSTHAAPAGAAAAVTKAAVSASGVASSGALGIYFGKFMALTKAQTALICLALASAPIAYEWGAAASARSNEHSLRTQLAQTQDAITLQQRAFDQAQRRLRSTDFALGEVRAMAARSSSEAIPAADAQLYLWDESSDYVRVPKQMLTNLTLSARAPDRSGRPRQEPVSIRNGTLSGPLAEALGVTREEEARVRESLQSFYRDYQQVDQALTYVTNQWLTASFGPADESYTLVTSRFPEQGNILKQQLRNALEAILGQQRTGVLWQQAEGEFREQLNEFGTLERQEGVALVLKDNRILHFKNGHSPEEKFPVYSWASSMPLDRTSVPDVFRPIVDGWKNRWKLQNLQYE